MSFIRFFGMFPFQTANEFTKSADIAVAASTAAFGIATAGVVLQAVGIVLGVLTLTISAKDLHNGSKSALAAEMREAANQIEGQLQEIGIRVSQQF